MAAGASAQDKTTLTEEKASEWIKVTETTTPKSSSAATRKKPATAPATQPKPVPPKEFEETNKKVNRFKKGGS